MFGDVNYYPYLCIVDLVERPSKGGPCYWGRESGLQPALLKKIDNIFPHTFGYVVGIYYITPMRKFLKIMFIGYMVSGVVSYLSKKK